MPEALNQNIDNQQKRLDLLDGQENQSILLDKLEYAQTYLKKVDQVQSKINRADLDDAVKSEYLGKIKSWIADIDPENIGQMEKAINIRLRTLENKLTIKKKEIPPELEKIVEIMRSDLITRNKSLTLLRLEGLHDNYLMSKIKDSFYQNNLKKHSQQSLFGRIADRISFFATQGLQNFEQIENQAQEIQERINFRNVLMSYILPDKKGISRAGTIEQAVALAKKNKIPGYDNWQNQSESLKNNIAMVDATTLELEKGIGSGDLGQAYLQKESFVRKLQGSTAGKKILFEMLQGELATAHTKLDFTTKQEIVHEVEDENIKEEFKKQLSKRGKEMVVILKEQYRSAEKPFNEYDLIKQVRDGIEQQATAHEQGMIEDRIRKLEFQKLNPANFEDSPLGISKEAKQEAYEILDQNYDLNDKYLTFSDEAIDRAMETIVINGALVVVSGGIASGVRQALLGGVRKSLAEGGAKWYSGKAMATTAGELTIEGSIFHNVQSAVMTVGKGAEAWDDYWHGIAHSIGMFGVIRGGKFLWNSTGRKLLELKFGKDVAVKAGEADIKALTTGGKALNYLGELATEVLAFTNYDIAWEKIIDDKPLPKEFWENFLKKCGDNLAIILELRLGGKVFGPMVQKSLLKSGEWGQQMWQKMKNKTENQGKQESDVVMSTGAKKGVGDVKHYAPSENVKNEVSPAELKEGDVLKIYDQNGDMMLLRKTGEKKERSVFFCEQATGQYQNFQGKRGLFGETVTEGKALNFRFSGADQTTPPLRKVITKRAPDASNETSKAERPGLEMLTNTILKGGEISEQMKFLGLEADVIEIKKIRQNPDFSKKEKLQKVREKAEEIRQKVREIEDTTMEIIRLVDSGLQRCEQEGKSFKEYKNLPTAKNSELPASTADALTIGDRVNQYIGRLPPSVARKVNERLSLLWGKIKKNSDLKQAYADHPEITNANELFRHTFGVEPIDDVKIDLSDPFAIILYDIDEASFAKSYPKNAYFDEEGALQSRAGGYYFPNYGVISLPKKSSGSGRDGTQNHEGQHARYNVINPRSLSSLWGGYGQEKEISLLKEEREPGKLLEKIESIMKNSLNNSLNLAKDEVLAYTKYKSKYPQLIKDMSLEEKLEFTPEEYLELIGENVDFSSLKEKGENALYDYTLEIRNDILNAVRGNKNMLEGFADNIATMFNRLLVEYDQKIDNMGKVAFDSDLDLLTINPLNNWHKKANGNPELGNKVFSKSDFLFDVPTENQGKQKGDIAKKTEIPKHQQARNHA